MLNLFACFNVISQSQHDAEMERGHPPILHHVPCASSSLSICRPNVMTILDDDPESLSSHSSGTSGDMVPYGSALWQVGDSSE